MKHECESRATYQHCPGPYNPFRNGHLGAEIQPARHVHRKPAATRRQKHSFISCADVLVIPTGPATAVSNGLETQQGLLLHQFSYTALILQPAWETHSKRV